MMFVSDIVLYVLLTYEADSMDGEWEGLLYRLRTIGQGLQHISSDPQITVYIKNKKISGKETWPLDAVSLA